MIIQAFPSGPFETNAYVVACPQTRLAAIIDPAPGSFDVIPSFLSEQRLQPAALLLTHSHWDHIADTARFKEKYAVPVCIHALDVPNLEHPGADKLPCWIAIPGVLPDRLLEEGDEIEIGTLRFRVLHTPGHTPGGICFYCPEDQVLISGDTLFKGTIGNLSFPTSRPDLMWHSLEKLAKLPPKTRVFPGHGPSTAIENESWLSNARKFFGN